MSVNTKAKVLKPSIQIPKLVLVFARLLQFISHKLVVIFASKLFVTPINFKTPKREIAMDESSQKRFLFIPEINKNIHILSYGFSDKKVLLAHGWSGRRTQLFMIANKLLEKGFMVVSFDAPAHGKSSGRTTNMIEYIKTITAINKEFGPFESAIGHSFGGMAIVNTNANKEMFKTIVTIGAGDKIEDIISNFIRDLGLKRIISKKLIQYLQKKWQINISNFALHKIVKKNKTPTLVVHDEKDNDVDVSCAYNIKENLINGSILISNGLGHTRILRDQNIINKTINFIESNSK
ncbi:MAG: Uncharacterised protein [Polaribacter sp. SA4-10]|nr:MAG: Uncharacterised protein [Polaribacter sp. SA4-10]|tara:strand:+ start:34 stop:912 length:879 start_codon:yes stop_codon:yes gene_type:complete